MNERIWTKDFIMIVLVNLFTFTSFYALLTLLPIYTMDKLNGTESQGGLLVTVFLLSAIVTRPFLAPLLRNSAKTDGDFLFYSLCLTHLFIHSD